jgi:adenylyltransferase/sulfurtransferase
MSSRYLHQEIFSRIGKEGQSRLGKSSAIIIGCGALGTVSASLLVRAGIGRIKLVDRDFVELTNLQRQMLFDEEDAKKSMPKAIAAAEKLKKINSSIRIEAELCDVQPKNIEKVVEGFNLILDGLDNMQTRLLINDFAIKKGIPWIYTAAVGSFGMMMGILSPKTPCLRCFVEELPKPGSLPSCDTVGVINTITSVVASLQVTEALRILACSEEPEGILHYVDVWEGRFSQMELEARSDCQACTKRNFEFLRGEKFSWSMVLCGREAVQISPPGETKLELKTFKEKLEKLGEVSYNGFLLNFKIEGYELIIFPDGRTIVKGTTDQNIARSLHARYIGI